MAKFNLELIQTNLNKLNIDGWLLFDFRGSNPLAREILDFSKDVHLTRRFFYYIPKSGTPYKIINGIEAHNFNHLPGNERKYSSHATLKEYLKEALSGSKIIAMEYSKLNSIPYLSYVDAGTFEFVKTFDVEIISSANLITLFSALWTESQYNENKEVANSLTEIVDASFSLIKKELLAKNKITEFDVQQFILNELAKRKYFTDHPPIIGVNENSANPHYAPTKDNFKEIKIGDFVLIDLWAKLDKEDGVWSDITWVGYAGETIPEKYINVFNIVRDARNAALNLVKERFASKKELRGYEVDDAARKIINDAGYGKYFIHRTGHSITTSLHGSGPHMDNYETFDDRFILPSTSFSIEPGIYITGDFGVRSEIDVFIHPDGTVEQTGGAKQEELIAILK